MSSFHNSSRPPEKKSSLPVRFIKWTVFQMLSFIFAIVLLGVGYAAWTTLDRNDAADGKPVTQTLMQGIVDNINDLNSRVTTLVTNLSTLTTRVTTLEAGQTTGGTVTGPLRWSSEYSGQNYAQAWNTCTALAPAGSWRIPSENDIEIGRHLNSGLFTGSKNYWSSSPSSSNSQYFLAWSPSYSYWSGCDATGASNCYYYGGSNFSPMVFRCVSNS